MAIIPENEAMNAATKLQMVITKDDSDWIFFIVVGWNLEIKSTLWSWLETKRDAHRHVGNTKGLKRATMDFDANKLAYEEENSKHKMSELAP